jgi:ATP-dependent Clp protease ATP-binding subunit ClpC
MFTSEKLTYFKTENLLPSLIAPGQAPQKENPVQQLIEAANTKALQRGVRKPGWLDVWEAICATEEYQEVLRERGVRVSDLGADLNFISKIGTKPTSEDPSINFDPSRSLFDISDSLHTARQELVRHLEEMQEDMRLDIKPEDSQKVMQVLERLIFKLSSEAKPEERPERIELKARLLEKAVTEALMGPDSALGIMMAAGPQGPEKNMLKLKISQIAQQVAMNLYREDMARYEETGDDIVGLLEGLKAESMFEPPSAIRIFDTIREASGDSYGKLLLRNGYYSTDETVETDKLAPLFPNDFIRNLALRAVSIAYENHSKEIGKAHILAALLENRQVMVNLQKLGMKDQLKFVEKYHELAFGKQDDEDGRNKIRNHPKVTDDFRKLLWDFDARVKEWDDEVRGPEMLCQIFREDKAVDKMLNEAGLLRKMERSWRSAYDEDWKLKKDTKDAKKEKKKEEELKVPDEFFEKLVEFFCTDYTALAKKKKFDPLIGQEKVMEDVITTMLKRGIKYPVITGDTGIGKTKILEGIAMRIVSGKVPPKLVGSRLLTLNADKINPMYAMYVGLLMQGIAERNSSGRFPLVEMAIDELSIAVKNGLGDTLKPYLTNGDLTVIGATPTKEFQRDVQKDPALARRFNAISMNAPSLDETIQIVKQNKNKYAKHHGVRIPDAMITLAAKLADRYISSNQPDKTIDAIDHALAIAARKGEKTLTAERVTEAISIASNISKEYLSQNDKQRYRDLPKNLKQEILQQDPAVDAVVAPLQRSRFGMREPGKPLGNFLFVGPSGVGKTELTRALARHLYGSDEEGKYLLRYDMSEFMEKHEVSKFIGSPPGYVGHDEGGRLINDVNAHPFSVILYDEIEKAHQDICNALLAPFSNGRMTDGQGRSANFKNTLNIMTSNIGNKAVMAMGKKLGLDPIKDYEAWQKMARPIYEAAVKQHFTPEFLGRLDGIIYFDGLKLQTIELLTDRRIEVTRQQLRDNNNGLDVELGSNFRKAVIAQGQDYEFGARPLNNAVKNMVETPLARHLLEVPDRKLARLKSVFMEVTDDWVVPGPEIIAAGAVAPDFTDRLKEKSVKIITAVSAPPGPEVQPPRL